MTSTIALTPAAALRAAADFLEQDPTRWGRDCFIDQATGCRCALGAISHALDPADTDDGNPMRTGIGERTALVLAGYLIEHLDALPAGHHGPWGDFVVDPVETVGEWNDRADRTVADVIEALRDAADDADKAATR